MKLNNILIFILFCIFVMCSKNNKIEDERQQFIEENFLEIIGKEAYYNGSFIHFGNDSLQYYSKLSVKLDPEVTYNPKMESLLLEYFENKKDLKKDFNNVIHKNYKNNLLLDSNFNKKIGNYYIFFNDTEQNKKIKYAGEIYIENLKIDNGKAVLIITKSTQKKGITYVMLFNKKGKQWDTISNEVLMYIN
ncbi:putative lipoprotein [Flavobacterium branchiophilum]|uniref:Probable lipoprotein n=1 Tax=Flavobacterium branchiophilum (strain FL-15) TaxID=1034807 RepID=G2Z277_FLABF|nr:hypothetical protein [Flavobacterium branchiophilum]CCB70032.1 Probable lipoprotein precursor [Flavobacterium branchiophilum FL-15]